MAVELPGSASPAAGFDQAFEMLGACHERVLRSLGLLRRLVVHRAGHGSDSMAADAARDVLRYFDLAAPAHHRDEELHVLPRLHTSGDPDLNSLALRLASDHRQLEQQWLEMRPLLVAVAAQKSIDGAELDARATAFDTMHRAHLAAEDRVALPAARRAALAEGPAALQAMGSEMARRRGVSWG